MGLKPDLVFNPRLVASTALEPFLFIVTLSLLLFAILLVALKVGDTPFVTIDFEAVISLRLNSTRDNAFIPVRASSATTLVSETQEY